MLLGVYYLYSFASMYDEEWVLTGLARHLAYVNEIDSLLGKDYDLFLSLFYIEDDKLLVLFLYRKE